MEFHKIPFQFAASDPVQRQAELQKRFGFPASFNSEVRDLTDPETMGFQESQPSPRLQHRLPSTASTDSDYNIDSCKKPNIRVVPIEIEGAENAMKRTSGPARHIDRNASLNVKSPALNLDSLKKVPTTFNIPIKIEHKKILEKEDNSQVKKPEELIKSIEVNPEEKNKCAINNIRTEEVDKCSVALKQIECVLEKLKNYEAEVNGFSGTVKDKKYKYLDEMLTRCMLELDNIESMGNEKLRSSRKTAIKKVQQCIDLLETRIVHGTNGEISSFTDEVNSSKSVLQNEISHCNPPDNIENMEINETAIVGNEMFHNQSCVKSNETNIADEVSKVDQVQDAIVMIEDPLLGKQEECGEPEAMQTEFPKDEVNVTQSKNIDKIVTEALQSGLSNNIQTTDSELGDIGVSSEEEQMQTENIVCTRQSSDNACINNNSEHISKVNEQILCIPNTLFVSDKASLSCNKQICENDVVKTVESLTETVDKDLNNIVSDKLDCGQNTDPLVIN